MGKVMSSNSVMVMSFEETKVPKFVEKGGKDWVLYGENNLYPQDLVSLFDKSAKHNAIVTGKAEYIVGNGLKPKEEAEAEKFKAFVKLFFTKPDKVNDELYKVALDLELFNGFCLEMIPTPGKKWTGRHINFSKMRSNKDGSAYYYSDDWSKFSQSFETTGLETYKPFRANVFEKSVIYFKSYRPKSGLDTYPLPDYIGCMAYIECDYQIANFHINNLRNGFTGATVINFFTGEPTPEEQKSIEKKLKKKFAGTDNAGGIVIVFSDAKSKEPKITNILPSDFDKQFDILNKTVGQEIFTGHKVTSPMLFGIKTEGQLGGRSELIEAYEMFQNVYINQRRQKILGVLNPLAALFGIAGGIEFINLEPLGFVFSEQIIANNLEKSEIREMISKRFGIKLDVHAPAPTSEMHLCENFSGEKTDDEVLAIFSKYGKSSQEFLTIKTRYIHRRRLLAFGDENGNQHLFIKISSEEAKILSLIEKNPDISLNEIAEALKISGDEALALMEEIKIKDMVIVDEASGRIEVSDIGGKSLKEKKIVKISSMYQYGLSPYVQGPEILPDGRTRPFCERLIGLDKMYTRNELNKISKEIGYDVWIRRGGFYTNPNNGITTPFCRHIWEMKIVTEK